jgi:spermidine synthase
MRRTNHYTAWLLIGFIILALGRPVQAVIVYEVTSPYHHIRVIDQQGLRTLSFDNSMETRMSLVNPLQGHFQYTEFFHLPWLWNPEMTNVLMIGLGGGSTQRAYQYFYPKMMVDTVEMDPIVVEVAKTYFQVRESPTLRIHVLDGRIFLRRADTHYDAIIMDAYVAHRYGSFIPYHLATREFFQLASDKLTADGVLAYNVIGTLNGRTRGHSRRHLQNDDN